MGKHKIIKSAAAVALTASVVATAAAPGASAASYKTNAKDQLVHTSTGKLVQGWKVFGGKLYKNGKLAPAKKYKIIGSGAAQRLYYGPTLKKGYKTANSKTLLFKDGKLADGWKQAGKNERLYKNGKLDKGYTVYTNVEGDKFLYNNGKLKKGQKTANRGGETLLFVDGKLAKGYVLHEASKTLFNNGKIAEGLVKYPATEGKYYNNGKLADGEINGVTYKDGVIVAKDVASVKAINDTTVEVTFKEAQKAENIKAADFKIEGLTVSNAALKQTDSKVVVLTTSKQEAGKEYVITYKENDTKTFVGFNAAIPKSIVSTEVKPYQTSQQAKIGEQVTVKATVTVAEGASKAGIPVTFVVDNNKDTATGSNSNQGKDQTVEVLTDENGVASYTYTQYAASTDTVTAYPTGAPTERTSTFVYWGVAQPLSVTDVTTEGTLANDSKKVYKVTGTPGATYNITFAENYEVTPDKVDYKAGIEANGLPAVTPFQSSISGQPVASKTATVTLNNKGEATFTVTGANTSVTPVVFLDDVKPFDRLDQVELQATASTIKFEDSKTVALTNAAVGTQKASAAHAKADFTTGKMESNQGGRTYIATLTDKDGKTAAAGTKVYLKLDKDATSKDVKFYVYKADGTEATVNAEGVYTLETDKNGKVTYVIASEKVNTFATPVVFLANKTGNNDATEAKGEITYFGDATVAKAEFKVDNKDAKDGITVKYTDKVSVTYQTVDQNGFSYAPADATKVAFNFNTTFGTLTVGGQTVAIGNSNSKALELTTDATGKVNFDLTTTVDTTANITASGNLVEVSNASAKIVFEQVGKTQTTTVTAAELSAVNAATTVAAIDAALASNDTYKTLTQAQKDALATTLLNGLKSGKTYNGAELSAAIDAAKNGATTPTNPTEPTEAEKALTEAKTALTTAIADAKKATAVEGKQEALTAAITAAEKALEEAKTAEEVKAAEKALEEAVKAATTEDEAPVKTYKVSDLGAAVTVDDSLVQFGGEDIAVTYDPSKLSAELKAEFETKKAFSVKLDDKTTVVLEANKTVFTGFVKAADFTKEAINGAAFLAE